jgi:uncharacterized membrane protein
MVLMGLGSASSFDVQLSTDSISSCPCTANTIKVEVENLYRDADTIELSLELPTGWSGFVQPDISLASGESDTVPVYITPTPCDIEPSIYNAVLNVESSITGDEISEKIEIETIKCHYVSIDLGETYRDVCQESNEGRVFGVVISNEGKFDEKFMLSTDTDWAIFSDDTIEISGGEEMTVELILSPPEDVMGVKTISISAQSDSSCAGTSEEVQVNIMNCYDFEATLTPAEVGDGGDGGELPSVTINEPEPNEAVAEPIDSPGITGALVGEGEEYPWESMIVAVIIIIVVLLIIYIVVRG